MWNFKGCRIFQPELFSGSRPRPWKRPLLSRIWESDWDGRLNNVGVNNHFCFNNENKTPKNQPIMNAVRCPASSATAGDGARVDTRPSELLLCSMRCTYHVPRMTPLMMAIVRVANTGCLRRFYPCIRNLRKAAHAHVTRLGLHVPYLCSSIRQLRDKLHTSLSSTPALTHCDSQLPLSSLHPVLNIQPSFTPALLWSELSVCHNVWYVGFREGIQRAPKRM